MKDQVEKLTKLVEDLQKVVVEQGKELQALRRVNEENEQLKSIVESQRKTIYKQQEQIEELLERVAGKKSEKLDPNQPFFEFMVQVADEYRGAEAPEEEQEVKGHKRRIRPHGRALIPDHLERVTEDHELPLEDRIDLETGEELEIIGYDIHEQLAYKASTLYVVQHRYPKYASRRNPSNGVKRAASPDFPIYRCKAHVSLLAYLLVSKYADHLPLYRIQKMFKRNGSYLPRNTMNGWVTGCAEALKPLYSLLKQVILAGGHVHTDDTGVPQQEKGTGSTKTAHAWAYQAGTGPPLVVYDYSGDRKKDHPKQFLKGFSGFVQADAYSGYDELFATRADVVEIACWAHARRYFIKAKDHYPLECARVLAYIQCLYKIEKRITDTHDNHRWEVRHRESLPILEELFAYIDELRDKCLPKDKLSKAITYASNQKQALMRYAYTGFLAIDNNPAERGMRPIGIGRRNWLFTGNTAGGETLAIILSFIESCKNLQINPTDYLEDVLARIQSHPARRLHELLPHNWKANQESKRQAEEYQAKELRKAS